MSRPIGCPRYTIIDGERWCRRCQIWVNYAELLVKENGLFHIPGCGYRVRTRPRNSKLKEKFIVARH